MADKALEDYLDDVLNDRIPVIPKLADLPSLWRAASAEASDSSHSGDPDRLTWLAMYIDMANTKPWARDGLRGLLQELLENGEPVPDLLSCWVHHQYAQGDPAPRRGRPEESERDFGVLAVFKVLLEREYSREAAMCFIAERMFCDQETVRSIIRKLERYLPYR